MLRDPDFYPTIVGELTAGRSVIMIAAVNLSSFVGEARPGPKLLTA